MLNFVLPFFRKPLYVIEEYDVTFHLLAIKNIQFKSRDQIFQKFAKL